MFKYLSITVVWLTEERKNQRYYSNHEHEKSKKNYTKIPYKYQRRPIHGKSNSNSITLSGSKLVADRFEAGRQSALNLLRTCLHPALNQLRTSFKPASIMEFGF